jgi:hypothetical protein
MVPPPTSQVVYNDGTFTITTPYAAYDPTQNVLKRLVGSFDLDDATGDSVTTILSGGKKLQTVRLTGGVPSRSIKIVNTSTPICNFTIADTTPEDPNTVIVDFMSSDPSGTTLVATEDILYASSSHAFFTTYAFQGFIGVSPVSGTWYDINLVVTQIDSSIVPAHYADGYSRLENLGQPFGDASGNTIDVGSAYTTYIAKNVEHTFNLSTMRSGQIAHYDNVNNVTASMTDDLLDDMMFLTYESGDNEYIRIYTTDQSGAMPGDEEFDMDAYEAYASNKYAYIQDGELVFKLPSVGTYYVYMAFGGIGDVSGSIKGLVPEVFNPVSGLFEPQYIRLAITTVNKINLPDGPIDLTSGYEIVNSDSSDNVISVDISGAYIASSNYTYQIIKQSESDTDLLQNEGTVFYNSTTTLGDLSYGLTSATFDVWKIENANSGYVVGQTPYTVRVWDLDEDTSGYYAEITMNVRLAPRIQVPTVYLDGSTDNTITVDQYDVVTLTLQSAETDSLFDNPGANFWINPDAYRSSGSISDNMGDVLLGALSNDVQETFRHAMIRFGQNVVTMGNTLGGELSPFVADHSGTAIYTDLVELQGVLNDVITHSYDMITSYTIGDLSGGKLNYQLMRSGAQDMYYRFNMDNAGAIYDALTDRLKSMLYSINTFVEYWSDIDTVSYNNFPTSYADLRTVYSSGLRMTDMSGTNIWNITDNSGNGLIYGCVPYTGSRIRSSGDYTFKVHFGDRNMIYDISGDLAENSFDYGEEYDIDRKTITFNDNLSNVMGLTRANDVELHTSTYDEPMRFTINTDYNWSRNIDHLLIKTKSGSNAFVFDYSGNVNGSTDSSGNIIFNTSTTLSHPDFNTSTNAGDSNVTIDFYVYADPEDDGKDLYFTVIVVDRDGEERPLTETSQFNYADPTYATATLTVTAGGSLTNFSFNGETLEVVVDEHGSNNYEDSPHLLTFTFVPNDGDFNGNYDVKLNYYVAYDGSGYEQKYDFNHVTHTVTEGSRDFASPDLTSTETYDFSGTVVFTISTKQYNYGKFYVYFWLSSVNSNFYTDIHGFMDATSNVTVTRVNDRPISVQKRIYVMQGRKYNLNNITIDASGNIKFSDQTSWDNGTTNIVDGTTISDTFKVGRRMQAKSDTATKSVYVSAYDHDQEDGKNGATGTNISSWLRLKLDSFKFTTEPTADTFSTSTSSLFIVKNRTDFDVSFRPYCVESGTLKDNDIILDVRDDDAYGVLDLEYSTLDADPVDTRLASTPVSCTIYVLPYGKAYPDLPTEIVPISAIDTPNPFNWAFRNKHVSTDVNRFGIFSPTPGSDEAKILDYIDRIVRLNVTSVVVDTETVKINSCCSAASDAFTFASPVNETVSWPDVGVRAYTNVINYFKPNKQGHYTGTATVTYTCYGVPSATVTFDFNAYCGDEGAMNMTVGDPTNRDGTLTVNGRIVVNSVSLPSSPTMIGYLGVAQDTISDLSGDELPLDTWDYITSVTLPAGVWRIDGHCMTSESNDESGSSDLTKISFGISTSATPTEYGPELPTTIFNVFEHVPLAGSCAPRIIASDGSTSVFLNCYLHYASAGDLQVTGTLLYNRIA